MKRIILSFLLLLLSTLFISCSIDDFSIGEQHEEDAIQKISKIEEDGYYSSLDEVALFIHTYNKLPENYITKSEAMELGWEASEGNLWEVTDKKIIGGDKFHNREGKLPTKEGRQYYEADVNYQGGYRGPERIVYSNDGLIYYTEDHYETFTLLFGDD